MTATTELIKIDAERAMQLLDEAVAERGADFVYQRPMPQGPCVYVHDGDDGQVPGCLIWLALHNAGVPLDTLFTYNHTAVTGLLSYRRVVHIDATDAAVRIFSCAQGVQDGGRSWGVAAQVARDKFNELKDEA